MFEIVTYCFLGLLFSFWLEEKNRPFMKMPILHKLGVLIILPLHLLKCAAYMLSDRLEGDGEVEASEVK